MAWFRIYYRFLSFVFICCLSVRAQKINIKQYGVSNGLPSSETYYVMQDSKSYIWIATDAGVVKYDGYNFITYTHTKGLPDNTIFKIHEDRKGKIWFASYSGKLSWYEHETDSIYTIPVNGRLSKYISSTPVDFYIDRRDTIWYSFSTKSYVKLIPPSYTTFVHCIIPGTTIFLKETDPKNYLPGCNFDGMRLSDFFLIGRKSDQNILYTQKLVGSMIHLNVVKDMNGASYFCNGNSLMKVEDGRVFLLFTGVLGSFNTINWIYCDPHNNMWLCTADKGLLCYRNASFSGPPLQYLPGENVSGVLEDKDGGVWITTITHGVFYIPSREIFSLSNWKASYAEWYKGKFYCNNEKDVLTSYGLSDTLGYQPGKYYSWLTYRSGDDFFIGASYSSIYHVATASTTYLYYEKEPGKYIVSIRCVSNLDSTAFIGLDNTFGALYRIDKKTGCCTELTTGIPRAFDLLVLNGTIYVGTKLGLYSFSKGQIKQIPLSGVAHDIRINAIRSIGDTLILATKEQGVFGLVKEKTVFRLREQDGLLSNLCKAICIDGHKNIWIGTNKGLTCFLYEQGAYKNYRNYTLHNGLNSNEINSISFYNDTICISTNSGVNYFNIDTVLRRNYFIPVYVEKCLVNMHPAGDLEGRELNYNENNIQFFFKALFPVQAGDLVYKYKLEGLDSSWAVSRNTSVQYTSLPPGNYSFVVSILSEGHNVIKDAAVKFTIQAPFWTTWWFITLMVLCGLLVLVVLYSISSHIVRKKEKKKSDMEKALVESELKALRAQMNPHFIFNAINSIQTFVIRNESAQAQKYLIKFSKLIRSVLEHSRNESIQLGSEVETLSLYMELEALRASFNFNYEVQVDPVLTKRPVYIPTMLVQPFVENAILHGVLPLSGREGKISVSFSEIGDAVVCVISDNGIGRKAAMELKRKKDQRRKSLGTEMTTQRIENLNRKGSFHISLQINDKYENGEAMGTSVILEIKNMKL
jgi:hypothetical protein